MLYSRQLDIELFFFCYGMLHFVLKIFQSESERKRKLEREERKIRDKAATGGFAPKQMYVQTENDSEEEITLSEPDSSEDN